MAGRGEAEKWVCGSRWGFLQASCLLPMISWASLEGRYKNLSDAILSPKAARVKMKCDCRLPKMQGSFCLEDSNVAQWLAGQPWDRRHLGQRHWVSAAVLTWGSPRPQRHPLWGCGSTPIRPSGYIAVSAGDTEQGANKGCLLGRHSPLAAQGLASPKSYAHRLAGGLLDSLYQAECAWWEESKLVGPALPSKRGALLSSVLHTGHLPEISPGWKNKQNQNRKQASKQA